MNERIPIRNAGLVLMNNYIPLLFERLGLTLDGAFNDIVAQHRAVHYLQYAVSGQSYTEELYLTLNKVICGLPPTESVSSGIEMEPDQEELIEGLLQAMIGHWSDIGDSSIAGFRGNWFVREGVLSEVEDRWELTVEKRSYDLLIRKSPFSFSIIKLPWMSKPIHVNWPY